MKEMLGLAQLQSEGAGVAYDTMGPRALTGWALQEPRGNLYPSMYTVHRTKGKVIQHWLCGLLKHDTRNWPYWYKRGYRVVRVKVVTL